MANHIKSVTLLHQKYPTTEHYPFNLPIFNRTAHLEFDTPVTLFVGDNGTGKSTLLEALARASGIHIWSQPEGTRQEVNRYEKALQYCLRLEWANGTVPGSYFGSERFKDFANTVEAWAAADPGQLKYFGGKSLITQSHGQSTMSYFRSRYQRKGIFFLDEPETALSPQRQLDLLQIIGKNSRAGHAQFIIATHSPILLACEEATIYSFDNATIHPIEYKETEHYKVYKKFLLDRR